MTFGIGTPYTKGAGYFVNDKNLRTKQEADVQTCPHCQAVILMQQWKVNGAWCSNCMKPVCGQRACMAAGCIPFARKLEEYMEKELRLKNLINQP